MLIGLFGAIPAAQQVIGDSEVAGGKKGVFIPIVLESSGLANQPVDNVPVNTNTQRDIPRKKSPHTALGIAQKWYLNTSLDSSTTKCPKKNIFL